MQVGFGPGHIVLDGDPSSSAAKGHSPPPQFLAHICCGQIAGWIKMQLGMEVGRSPCDCVIWGPSSPFPKMGWSHPIFGPCLLWPNGWMDQDGTCRGGGPRSRPHCARWDPAPAKRGQSSPQFSAHVRCGQMAGWIKRLLGMEVGLGPGDIVFDGDPAPPPPTKGAQPPIFVPCLMWPNGWMDEETTWYRRRPWPHVGRGLSSTVRKGTAVPLFLADICCGHGCAMCISTTAELLFVLVIRCFQ